MRLVRLSLRHTLCNVLRGCKSCFKETPTPLTLGTQYFISLKIYMRITFAFGDSMTPRYFVEGNLAKHFELTNFKVTSLTKFIREDVYRLQKQDSSFKFRVGIEEKSCVILYCNLKNQIISNSRQLMRNNYN